MSLVGFNPDRENLHFGTKTLNEDRVAFLASNYSQPSLTFSSIYVLQVARSNASLIPEKKINMELFRDRGWDPSLSAVNIDFFNNTFPYIMAFPRNSPHIYSLDLAENSSKSKAMVINQDRTKTLTFFNSKLVCLDRQM